MTQFIQSLSHTWEPFVLIVGLLFIGHVAAQEGLFEKIGEQCARVPGSSLSLFVMTMLAVAVVTAVLNLDTAVVFMTPVALRAARSRGADEKAFLYGTILMTNSASLLLLGSNLTNMLVVASQPVRGSVFAVHMVFAWVTSVLITIVVVAWWCRKGLTQPVQGTRPGEVHWSIGPGFVSTLLAVAMMLALSHPALPIFILGALVELYYLVVKRRVGMRDLIRVASPIVVLPLFAVAVAVGWLSRVWDVPSHWLAHSGALVSALAAALAAVLINNLPAASLFAGQHITHPYALLVGLDLGPNIFVTGAMSTMLWIRIARQNGASPTIASFSRVGLPVALLSIFVASMLV
jgi:arsenical pump membrane protein